MDSSIYVSTAAQRSLGRQLEIIANNIANSTTVGYRSEKIDFSSIVARSGGTETHFPNIAGLYANPADGSRLETGNPLDVAITGDGWFGIMTPAGAAYTRDGRFEISPNGDLLTTEGNAVLDSGGAPISIGNVTDPISVSDDGRITVNGKAVAEIGLFALESADVSKRYGNSSFMSAGTPQSVAPGDGVSLHQGFIENSNVNMMREMANLITVTRLFEGVSTAIEKADKTMGQAINELSQRR